MNHEQASCSFNVDLEMRPIIQAIINNFNCKFSTHASCQECDDKRAYILVRCSELREIDELKRKLFEGLSASFEYEGRDFFRVSWDVAVTRTIVQRCHGLEAIGKVVKP